MDSPTGGDIDVGIGESTSVLTQSEFTSNFDGNLALAFGSYWILFQFRVILNENCF